MVDLKEAEAIAAGYLAQMEADGCPRLQVTKVLEEAFGWVFFYQSHDHLMSGKLSDALAGNAPFAVLRNSGGVEVFGTAMPLDFYVAQMNAKLESGG